MTYQCAVIGNPIAHSKSPEIHAVFAREYRIDLDYQKILAEDASFEETVRCFFASGGRGLNITVPFKQRAFAMADFRTPYAEKAGAANTLWMKDGGLCADNTDGKGLVFALQNLPLNLKGLSVLIIGAGGAARGIVLPLIEAGANRLDIINRTLSKAEAILKSYAQNSLLSLNAYALDESITQQYDLIINATSTGLSGQAIALPPQLIKNSQSTVCYDMVYGRQTPFMQWAEDNGVQHIYDGLSMLKGQAKISFLTWFQKEIADRK